MRPDHRAAFDFGPFQDCAPLPLDRRLSRFPEVEDVPNGLAIGRRYPPDQMLSRHPLEAGTP